MFSQIRLILAGIVLVAFVSLGAVTAWYRGQAIAADRDRARALAELSTAQDVNRAQEATIGRLRAEQARVDQIMARVAGQIAEINTKLTESNAALVALKDDDATVRDYLATPIPDALRGLLEHAKNNRAH